MKKDIYGRTRLTWATQWGVWWIAVFVAVFLGYQLSRPLWDADRLIREKQQSCERQGMVIAKHRVKFGDVYSCQSEVTQERKENNGN